MPANKNALTRIAILDKLLSDRYHAYSIQDMTDYLERELTQFGHHGGVSKRCVEKDIEYLEYNSPFDVEFERYTVDSHSGLYDKPYKKRCIRYSDPTFSIFKGKLTANEKSVLTSAISSLGSFDGIDTFGWLDDLSKRLGLVEKSPVILMSRNVLENKTLMAEAFAAINSRCVVRIHYHKYSDDSPRDVVLSPYHLKEYNGRWYLIGGAYDKGRILNFALDRIDGIEILLGYKYVEPPIDLAEMYEDIIGVTFIEENPVEKILFWVSDESKGYVETKPIHESQIHLKGESDEKMRSLHNSLIKGAFFQIQCKKNYELIRELCSFGAELKVLSPKPIVDAIKNRLSEMCNIYAVNCTNMERLN